MPTVRTAGMVLTIDVDNGAAYDDLHHTRTAGGDGDGETDDDDAYVDDARTNASCWRLLRMMMATSTMRMMMDEAPLAMMVMIPRAP